MLLRQTFILIALVTVASAQVIEFESGGLQYQTITKGGVTVMWSHLPTHLRDYAVLQIAVSNGSPVTWTVKPEDISIRRNDGSSVTATPARKVVNGFLDRGGRNDVIKLVSTYEQGLYGMQRFRSTNGYEVRRQQALAEVSSTRLKAAAAASAIVFVQTKLAAGQSTDGAVFFQIPGKVVGPGKLVLRVAGEIFEFEIIQ